MSYHIISYHIIYHIISYRIISYHIYHISYHTLYYIIIKWDHRRIIGPSLTETSLCGGYLYSEAYQVAAYLTEEPVASIFRVEDRDSQLSVKTLK